MAKSKDPKQEPEMEKEAKEFRRRALDALPAVGGSVGGALVGLAVGGPAGAVTGAVVSPAATALFEIVKDSLQRRASRAEMILAEAAELRKESVVELENHLTRNDDRLAFATIILTSAADTPLPEKLTAFSRLLASGADIEREKLVNEYTMMARALAAMDESHIRVLAKVSTSQEGRNGLSTGLTPDQLSSYFGVPSENLRPFVRLLEFYGLITDVGTSHIQRTPSPVYWQITELGLACLNLLRPNTAETENP